MEARDGDERPCWKWPAPRAVKDRSQMSKPEGAKWTEWDKTTGQCSDQKKDDEPFKGVRREH